MLAECAVQEWLLPARHCAEPGTVQPEGCRDPGLLPDGRCCASSAHSQPRSGPEGCCPTMHLSPQSLYGVYYKCPCEAGLSCNAKWSIGGSITNTDYGVCYDKRDPTTLR